MLAYILYICITELRYLVIHKLVVGQLGLARAIIPSLAASQQDGLGPKSHGAEVFAQHRGEG